MYAYIYIYIYTHSHTRPLSCITELRFSNVRALLACAPSLGVTGPTGTIHQAMDRNAPAEGL